MVEETFFNITEQIITEIQREIKNYEQAVRNKKKLSELKSINTRIRDLVKKLKQLHPDT